MTLFILKIGDGDSHALYDGKSIIMTGGIAELYDWKDKMESAEMCVANRLWRENLKSERIAMLVEAGHTEAEATNFLKEKMAFLWD